jgi:hypothetical protein
MDWQLVLQTVTTLAAAAAAVAAWRSAALSSRSIKLAKQDRVRRVERRLALMRSALEHARWRVKRHGVDGRLNDAHDEQLRNRLAELLDPSDILPDVRALVNREYVSDDWHLEAAIEVVDIAESQMREGVEDDSSSEDVPREVDGQ